ncbi:polyubiquitin-tagged protein recognition complex Npl4 component [Vararia minispora EC-137]|uniref:Polyubiquitin-tagged protein recognition complex Npl4 component n=1 Tax=Vararia minispora EC-137 TaxID=1314806 RepID=A0ACB8QBN1_9AGAM|nr:polyubiquitin-tagged protein recognition complex Npl4 component [Vararia minispora EC-137]
MLVRIRSKDGTFRFDVQPTTTVSELAHKILETTSNADPSTLAISSQPRGGETILSTLIGRTLQSLGLRHGDLIFVSYQEQASASRSQEPTTPSAQASSSTSRVTLRPWEKAEEHPVDVYLRKQDGMISRPRDTRFCKHGTNAMCDYCMPLEPYDPKYHEEHSIKHLSYHAHLRKLTPKTSSSSTASLPPLSEPDYRVKVPCPAGGHPNWPAGICTACQPSAITLQSQPFRMVDHVEIQSPDIIDRFIGAWRKTGVQRFGWLIGRYEAYDKVPLGVKAIVEAIHEPPQEGEVDGLTLGIPWDDEARVRALAASARPELSVIGYVFTDLDPVPDDRSKLQYKRHPNSFFLSSLEVLFAAHIQAANPLPSRAAESGVFGSRMVTCVLTGNEEGTIGVNAYQVSEQVVGMLQADMIEASVDPSIMRVKEESRGDAGDNARYLPDVFFRYRNEYGLEVKKSAKPAFPVEYLLVNVTNGFPQNSAPIIRSQQFPIENRPGLEDQSIELVLRRLNELHAPDVGKSDADRDAHRRLELAKWLSDWHLIAFLGTSGLFSEADMQVLARVASAPVLEDPQVLDPLLTTDSWQTIITFARESAPPPQTTGSGPSSHLMDEDIPPELLEGAMGASGGGGGSSSARVCPHCTFENHHSGSDCDVCGLPL